MAADLAKFALFQGLPEADLRNLGARWQTRQLPVDGVLIKQGEAADSLFLILRGRVKVVLSEPSGKEFVVDVRGAGQYVGEMMLDEKPRSASVIATEPSEVAVIPRAEFKSVLAKHPEVAMHLIRNLINLARGHNVRTIEDVRSRSELQIYIEQLKGKKAEDLPSVKGWVVAKRWMLVTLLAFAVLQYYFLHVFVELMSMSGTLLVTP
jgi:CRP/FNR family cyclic AMP-dependent transcriptional regulator